MTKKDLYDKFIFAVKDNNLEVVKECVKNGVDVNKCYDINGSSPLYLCLQKNKDVALFRYLVANGADVTRRIGPDSVNNWKKPSLLSFAIEYDAPLEIIKTIIEKGGDRDINYAPKGDYSPLEKAFMNKDKELVQLFSKYCDFRMTPKLFDHQMKTNRRVIKKI